MSGPTLEYPLAAPPAPGGRLTVRDGLDWIRQPLPFRLDHVNCWWLDAGTGSDTVQIDTGIASDVTRDQWRAAVGVDPRTLLVTHFHPDHAGCAGEYAARGVELLGNEVEMRLSSRIHALPDDEYGDLYAAWYARHGLPDEVVERARAFGNGYRKIVAEPAPLDRYRWLDAGDVVTLGGRDWQVLTGRGHAPEMLMLFDADEKLLIAADQVLPSISPNVSVGPRPAPGVPSPFRIDEPDPLARFLESLEALRVLPPDTLVLPSHGLPFFGLQTRLDALASHHEERLAAVLGACLEPCATADLFPVLFGKKLDAQQMSFALGEALAHAQHLVAQGRLLQDDSGSVTRFVAVTD